MTRALDDHGTHAQALDFALHVHDDTLQTYEFLKAWSEGALDEWPEYYDWLDQQPTCAPKRPSLSGRFRAIVNRVFRSRPPVPLRIDGPPCTLEECPPGLFLWHGHLGFKTEYRAMQAIGPVNVPGPDLRWVVGRWPEAFVVDSGEFFWGGAKRHEERAELIVQPVSIVVIAGIGR